MVGQSQRCAELACKRLSQVEKGCDITTIVLVKPGQELVYRINDNEREPLAVQHVKQAKQISVFEITTAEVDHAYLLETAVAVRLLDPHHSPFWFPWHEFQVYHQDIALHGFPTPPFKAVGNTESEFPDQKRFSRLRWRCYNHLSALVQHPLDYYGRWNFRNVIKFLDGPRPDFLTRKRNRIT